MKKDNDPIERNQPAEAGRKNDPDLRDESAAQPGVSTMSSSPTDDANQHLTRTASDTFDTDLDFGKNADKAFDDISDTKEEQ